MHERTPDQKNNYFRELTRNLQREGFAVSAEENDLLPVELAGRRLCQVTSSGGVQHWREDIADEHMSKALERVTDIAGITDEYMGQLDTAPFLKVGSTANHYRLLAEFNGTVLAGCQTEYGAQFITWWCSPDRASLDDGHYYGPGCGVDSYTAAKQDFATRSGLIPRSILASEQKLCETVFYLARSAQRLEQKKFISVIDENELFNEILGAVRRFEESPSGEEYTVGLERLEGWLMGAFPYSEELDDRRQFIMDFIRFESETANIWPWALSADEIIQNENLLGEVERIVEFDQEDKCDTDVLYSALDRLAGINPALKLPDKSNELSQNHDFSM